jgi:hypothetical protein
MDKWQIYAEWEMSLPNRFDPELAAKYPDYRLHHKVFHATPEEMKDLLARYRAAEAPSRDVEGVPVSTRPPYEVKREGNRLVEGWAQQRLPFEPKGWMKDFRQELRVAIRGLIAGPGEVLHATYTNPQTDRVDVENALIYNVDPGAFRSSAHTGLTFERSFNVTIPPQPHLTHYYRYEIAPGSQPLGGWHRGPLLAEWNSRLVSLAPDTKPETVWWATKHGELSIHADTAHAGWFGLELEVQAPATGRSLADIVKPLADGSIVAFQSHAQGPDVPELAVRVARGLGVAPAAVAEAFCDEATAVVDGHRILWKRGTGVQWNPADERCVGAVLRLAGVTTADWVVRGKLFQLEPRL